MFQRISKAVSLEETSMSALSSVATAAMAADGIDDSYDDYETFSNWSYQRSPACDGCFCPVESCPDHPFIRRVVRWVKVIARSKHGMTVVCGIIPLLLGLLIGFYLGRNWEPKQVDKIQQGNLQSRGWLTVMVSRMFQRVVAGFLLLQVWCTALVSFVLTARWTKHQNTKATESPQGKTCATTTNSFQADDMRLALIRDPTKYRESGVDLNLVPKHIAFIMDGNRRYGKSKYKSVSRGHMDGGYKLRDMVHWCMEECINEMTVYAFSTENWNRSPAEIDALMSIFCAQCEELRKESVKLQIVVRVLSTETDPIPDHVKEKLKQLEDDTRHCQGSLFLNVCLSYGSRGELVGACRSLAADCRDGKLQVDAINEQLVESRLLTRNSPPPDIILRTSGEVRISNFLLWQCAYSEFFFLTKHWPDLEKQDLMDVIRTYAHGRKRRFGS